MQTDMRDLESVMLEAYGAWKRDGGRRDRAAATPATDPRVDAVWGAWTSSGVPERCIDLLPCDDPVGWAYVWGPVGSGKTTGACRMLRRYVEERCREIAPGLWSRPRVKFTTAQGYLEDVRAAWQTPEMDRALVNRGCSCLVLDDLGQEPPTEWAVSRIFDLVDHRWSENLPTIVTSQFPLDALEARLARNGGEEQAAAIVSRLVGSCRVVRLDSGDRRLIA